MSRQEKVRDLYGHPTASVFEKSLLYRENGGFFLLSERKCKGSNHRFHEWKLRKE
jgi:hypothetical protein